MNLQVLPKTTPPVQVWGMMRVGPDTAPLARIDFASDEKRTKLVARDIRRQKIGVRVES